MKIETKVDTTTLKGIQRYLFQSGIPYLATLWHDSKSQKSYAYEYAKLRRMKRVKHSGLAIILVSLIGIITALITPYYPWALLGIAPTLFGTRLIIKGNRGISEHHEVLTEFCKDLVVVASDVGLDEIELLNRVRDHKDLVKVKEDSLYYALGRVHDARGQAAHTQAMSQGKLHCLTLALGHFGIDVEILK